MNEESTKILIEFLTEKIERLSAPCEIVSNIGRGKLRAYEEILLQIKLLSR